MSTDIVADTDCPECAQGKHPNCDGGSWDQTTDAPAACPCWARDHEGDEIPAEVVDRLDRTIREAVRVVAAQTPEQDMADRLADRYEAQLDRQGGEDR